MDLSLPEWVADWARKAPDLKVPPPGPKSKVIIEKDRKYVSHAYDRLFQFTMKRSSGAAIMDEDGNVYLDFSSGISVLNAGWSNPKVVQAIKDQAELSHTLSRERRLLRQGGGLRRAVGEDLSRRCPGVHVLREQRCRGSGSCHQALAVLHEGERAHSVHGLVPWADWQRAGHGEPCQVQVRAWAVRSGDILRAVSLLLPLLVQPGVSVLRAPVRRLPREGHTGVRRSEQRPRLMCSSSRCRAREGT